MNFLKHLLVFSFLPLQFLALLGCTSFQNKNQAPAISLEEIQKQETELTLALEKLDAQDFKSSHDDFQEFLTKNPVGVFTLQAKLGLAKSLMGLQKYQQARALFAEIRSTALDRHEIRVQAAFWASENHRALGEEILADASLKESVQFAHLLNDKERWALLPVILGKNQILKGEFEQGIQQFQQARTGLMRIFGSSEESKVKTEKARLFKIMGSSQLSSNAKIALDQFQQLQTFLIQSIELEDPIWSPQAKDYYINFYTKNLTGLKKSDEDKALLEQILTNLTIAREKILAGRPNGNLDQISKFTRRSIQVGNNLLLSWSKPRPQTESAQQRQSLKKEGLKLLPVAK